MSNPITRLEKALLLLTASIQAQAAMSAWGPVATTHPVSTDVSDPTLRALNLENWEEVRIFYAANVKALADDTNWPPPDLGVADLLGGLANPSGILAAVLPAIASAIAGPTGATLVTAIEGIIGQLTKPTTPVVNPTPTNPIPNP